MKKYQYNINNLDCIHCAKRVEDSLNKKDDFNNVSVNFNTCKLSFESSKNFKVDEVNRIVKEIEPNANVSETEINKKEYHISILIIGILIGILAYFLPLPNILKIILEIISYILLLYRVIINAFKLIIKNKTIDENLLITISCIGAFIIGEVLEGMMVIVLYTIGKIFESLAVNNSRKSIREILDLKIKYAYLKQDNNIKKISVDDIKVGDTLLIKKGDKIPTDGIVTKGMTMLDTSMLTGESDLYEVKKGSNVLSGSINCGDVIEMTSSKLYSDSTASKILELLENATNKKAKIETTVSKISRYYTPTILLLAILTVIILPICFNISLEDAFYRSLTFLVISCPCAIAISVPLSYFTGIGVSSKNGILIKGSNYLDGLSNIKNIIFDKTGTLTSGAYEVTKIDITDSNYSEKEIISILRKAESMSSHPIAKSIMKLTNEKINNKDITNYKETEGAGISCRIKSLDVLVGNNKLCKCQIKCDIHLHINNKHVASISINDGIKENVINTIKELKKRNIKTYMFTGDKKEVALSIGKKLDIDKIYYEMLPQDKYNLYEKISNNSFSSFVGDGINDAPVLKRSDIGISMGNIGTDAAIEASDIVIPTDDIKKIILGINISSYTKYIIKENLIFAMSVKIIILFLSILGYANMWLAVFADTGVTLLTILNTLRIMRKFK